MALLLFLRSILITYFDDSLQNATDNDGMVTEYYLPCAPCMIVTEYLPDRPHSQFGDGYYFSAMMCIHHCVEVLLDCWPPHIDLPTVNLPNWKVPVGRAEYWTRN